VLYIWTVTLGEVLVSTPQVGPSWPNVRIVFRIKNSFASSIFIFQSLRRQFTSFQAI
jgi:hypothetical protein